MRNHENEKFHVVNVYHENIEVDPVALNIFTGEEERSYYNSLPIGWESMTEKEVVQSHYLGEYAEYSWFGQAVVKMGGCYESIHYYRFSDGAGLAFYTDYWAGKIHWFRFGCKHSYEEMNQRWCHENNVYHAGNCWHVYKCRKCGHVKSTDSSD